MFFSDMERKTLATTPLSSTFFFHLRGGGIGSSKKTFHCLLLLSCILLSSVNTLHNLAEFESDGGFINGYNNAIAKGIQSFNGGNVCPIFSFLSDLESKEYHFDDDNPKPWISNNLSDGDVVWLSLKPLHIFEFHPQPFTGLFHIGEEEDTKQQNRDELSSLVSGGNGFIMEQNQPFTRYFHIGEEETKQNRDELLTIYHQCEWESIKFLFLYRNELVNGVAVVFAVPMKATAPVLMLNLCKKPVFWVQVQRAMKKLLIGVLVIAAALLILIFCCFNDHCSHIAPSITISPEMDSLLRSISKETLKPIASSLGQEEASKTAKKRRNKKNKKKKSGNGLLLLLTDVSSSYSGNSSTPNSPMSPLMVSAPKPEPTTIEAAMKTAKPVLSHSATFPVCGVKSMVLERSLLALNVRAPGSKVKSRTEEETETETEKKAAKEYDIWGDHHLTGLNLMDRFKEVREGKSKSSGFVVGEEDESFFVKGPQNYLADSHVGFVSFCNQWG